jgi:lipoprotein-anchoring transpeptidase ErfK/SrfK
MPYSIFYNGHFAIHGTDQVKKLGRPASSGCIRLHPKNAAKLFDLVKTEGLENARVVVVD